MNNTVERNNGSKNDHSNNEDNSTPETIVTINCALNAPLMFISILGNALVLTAIIRTPSIRSTSMIMLCSLAVSDLLVGLITQPLYIVNELTKHPLLDNFVMTMALSVCGISLITMTAISMDRFLALHYHMRYATLVTESRVKYTLVIIWLISFLEAGLSFWNERVHYFLISFINIFCLIVSTFSYIRIYLIVRRHQLQIHAQQQAVQSFNAENNLNMARLKRSAMNTFVFYLTLITCYVPLYIVLTLHGVTEYDENFQTEWKFVDTVVFMNSSINPFLYCWRLRELRKAVVKTARQMLCKQHEEN